jgi:hypothetical protein
LQWKLPEQDSQYKSKQVQVLAETIESERWISLKRTYAFERCHAVDSRKSLIGVMSNFINWFHRLLLTITHRT